MEIRAALESDAAGISELIQLVSMQCNFSETEPCPQWFIESTKPDVLQPLIVSDDYLWLIAVERGEVTGVLTLFEGNLVKYLFVHPEFQRKGVARALWQRAIPELRSEISVRSSLFAIPFYEKREFKKVGEVKFFNGVSFQTMIAQL
ncbi:GNAT family N-acetyltransferase [Pantoea agglomerans]|uniref:GNAT family N-acetyltransferase n=1 Tax=Enterobacter agglomerans TaxID=549 RepID=UPI001878A3CE|nr:GNAT family N-acetyltransferase [Pantoea agglomerans]MBE5682179.1 GNAT family N-acetyltransferase [Pantoea agglomerans]QTC52916.1 GNAT family N-acetyltransferase [Pantoea agglomerans]